MKNYMLIIIFGILSLYNCCLSTAKAAELAVNIEKVRTNNFTKFITHVVWPSEAIINAKRIDKELIKKDVEELSMLLKRTLCVKYLPSQDQLKEAVACLELMDGHDYILLRCSCKDTVDINIQKGAGLYLLIDTKTNQIASLKETGEFIKKMAVEFLNLPLTNSMTEKDVRVFVSSRDIGASKCGTISCGPKDALPEHWFNYIRWWTDGRRVLFAISRKDWGEELRHPSALPNAFKPMRFHFRDKVTGDVSRQTTNQPAVGFSQIPGTGKTNDLETAGDTQGAGVASSTSDK